MTEQGPRPLTAEEEATLREGTAWLLNRVYAPEAYAARLRMMVDLMPAALGSELPGLIVFSAIAATLSGACALLSWRLVEAPALRWKRYLHTSGGQPRARAAGAR